MALVKAFAEYLDLPLGEYEIARLAYDIERIDLGLMGGDRTSTRRRSEAATSWSFFPDDRVIVNPLRVREAHRHELDSSLVICHTGRSRSRLTSSISRPKASVRATRHPLRRCTRSSPMRWR